MVLLMKKFYCFPELDYILNLKDRTPFERYSLTTSHEKYLIVINTFFKFFNILEFEKYIEIIKEISDISITKTFFTEESLKYYLHYHVKKDERIFKSNGFPYEKYVKLGYYSFNKGADSKIYITKKGTFHLYNFLKMKKIIID